MLVKRGTSDYYAMMEHLDCCKDITDGVRIFNKVQSTNYSPNKVAFQYAVRNIRLKVIEENENPNANYL